ncbi:MAG: hypothetical protein ACOVOQ_10295 [Flavobacterium sp.]
MNCLKSSDIDLDTFLSSFDKNYLAKNEEITNIEFKGITDDLYSKYIPFLSSFYIFSATIGFFVSKLILFFGLDTRFKFLRFKNNWHYIFSGKFFKFKKYSEHNLDKNLKVKYTFVDVLVSGEGEKPSLYSGLLADYDLCPENINKIERVHLLKATRYKKENNTTVIKNIPGNLFTIIGDKILNINCTYILFNQNELKYKKFNDRKNVLILFQILTILIFICSFVLISFKLFENQFLEQIINKSFWYKLFLLFNINIVLGLLTPFRIDWKEKEINFIGWKAIKVKLLLIAITSAILYLNF